MTHHVDENVARPESRRAGPLKTVLVSMLILLGGIALIWLIFRTEPSATRQNTARETAMLVDVRPVNRGRYTPVIDVMGQVVPAREVMLASRVSGQVIAQADVFSPGRRVAEGEELLRIEPADYRIALQQRRSELQQARADLELEQGQQAVARQEYELLGEQIETGSNALVLRKPQLQTAEARVAAAEASLRQAQLELDRTRVRAPFDAQVLDREVTVGSQVSSGQALGRLVATDEYWVQATVPLSQLSMLRFADDPAGSAAAVTLRHDTVWPPGATRSGQLTQLVGELDSNARMARVLITVADPLALDQARGQPPLILGTLVSAAIEGRPLEDVVRLERNLIRRNNTVWVMEDRKLAIRDVEIVFRNEDYAYIREGLDDGDQVITSELASVVSGARLRLESDSDE